MTNGKSKEHILKKKEEAQSDLNAMLSSLDSAKENRKKCNTITFYIFPSKRKYVVDLDYEISELEYKIMLKKRFLAFLCEKIKGMS